MPKEALAETLVDWAMLIGAARLHESRKPELKWMLDELQNRLDRAKALDCERQSLQARKQQATQDLRQVRDEGKDLASRTRNLLKATLGTQNEALMEFNIRPRRPYGKRKAKSEGEAPPRRVPLLRPSPRSARFARRPE